MNNQRFSDEVKAELKDLSLRISHLAAKVGLLQLENVKRKSTNQSLLTASMASSMFIKRTDCNAVTGDLIADDAVSMDNLSPEIRGLLMKLLTNNERVKYDD